MTRRGSSFRVGRVAGVPAWSDLVARQSSFAGLTRNVDEPEGVRCKNLLGRRHTVVTHQRTCDEAVVPPLNRTGATTPAAGRIRPGRGPKTGR